MSLTIVITSSDMVLEAMDCSAFSALNSSQYTAMKNCRTMNVSRRTSPTRKILMAASWEAETEQHGVCQNSLVDKAYLQIGCIQESKQPGEVASGS